MDRIFIIIAGVALVSFLILSLIVAITSKRRRLEAMSRYQYRPKRSLMTGNERRCFQLLNDIFGERFYIIPNVSLENLLSHKVGNQNRDEAYGFIHHKTVDFVFCNKRTLRPVCAVKFDDNAHTKDNDLGSNPKDMEKFFRSAHLPFVRIVSPKKLNRDFIIEEFSRVIYETSLLPTNSRTTRATKITTSLATPKTSNPKSSRSTLKTK